MSDKVVVWALIISGGVALFGCAVVMMTLAVWLNGG